MHWQELLEIMLKLDRLSLKNRIYCHWKVAKRKKKSMKVSNIASVCIQIAKVKKTLLVWGSSKTGRKLM